MSPRAVTRVVVLALLVFGVGGHFAVNPIVEAAYDAGAVAALERVGAPVVVPGSNQNSRLEYSMSGAERPAPGTLDHHQRQVRIAFGRAWLAVLLLVVAGLVWRYRDAVRGRLVATFHEEDHPLTLGILRIAVFAVLLKRFNADRWLWFSDFPRELAMPPPGLAWVLDAGVIDRGVAAALCPIFVVLLFMAMIGLFTRASAAAAILLGLYIWGIPKFFGATFYQHSLFWLGALCAAAPSGDALSVDALIRAWRKPGASLALADVRSTSYARPARVAWLFFGVLYFFPGWWKVWECGFDFAFSDNLIHIMRGRWIDGGGNAPWFRPDLVPPLVWIGGLNVLLWELAFPFAMFSPRMRVALLAEGVFFHIMNVVVLYIDFMHMTYCYVVFIDVRALLQRAGRRLWGAQRELVYDAASPSMQRVAAIVKVVDVFDAVRATPAATGRIGAGALVALAPRLPLAWVLSPIVVPLLALAQALAPAAGRTGPSPALQEGDVERARARARRASWLATRVGAFIFSAGFVAGALELDQGWPFACYPPFGWIGGPFRHSVRPTATTADGKVLPYDEDVIIKRMSGNWSAQVNGFVLLTPEPALREQRMRALWRLYTKAQPAFGQAAHVQLDEVTLRIDPEHLKDPPVVARRPLLQLSPADLPVSP